MSDKRNLIKVIMLMTISSIIIFYGISSLYLIDNYPKKIIYKEDLYGENGSNLKDFNMDGDGNIVSTSDDPWVTFKLSGLMNIKVVDIVLDSINTENSWAQIFFILEDDTWEYEKVDLHKGTNHIEVNGKKGFCNVHTIRFDLTSDSGVVINLNEIRLNCFYQLKEKFKYLSLFSCVSLILFIIILKRKETDNLDGDRDIFTGIILVFQVTFLLCIFAPLDLYFNNGDEFRFELFDLLPLLVIMSIVAALVGIVFFFLVFWVFKKLYHSIVVFTFIIFIGCYLQGNYFVSNLPPLDGTKFNWADYPAGKFESVLLWYIVAVAGIILFKILKTQKFYSIVKYTSSFIIAILTVTLCVEYGKCVTSYEYQNKLNAKVTTKNQFESKR